MSRIAVIGSRGQLGADLTSTLGAGLIHLDRPDFDVQNADTVAARISSLRPDVIINCAAMTNVDLCEDEPGLAYRINAAGANHVARAAADVGAYLIQISTDYVFGGDTSRVDPYTESDTPLPINAYGQSKFAGERFVGATCQRYCVVRTAGLFGYAGARGKGGNFVETILARATAGESLRVVDDQRTSPTSTRALATLFPALIAKQPTGVLHLAASDSASWHEFAQEIVKQAGLDVLVAPISSSESPRRAKRPHMSALRSERLAEIGLPGLPRWREMLADYLANARTRHQA